jgi:hypothetical protein
MTVDELRQAIRALPPLLEHAERFTWLFRRKDLRRMILEANPEEFLTWPVVKESMFVGNAPYIQGMLDDILVGPKWLDKYYVREDDILSDPRYGQPELFNDHRLLNKASGNLIVQRFHIVQWEKSTGSNLQDMQSIVEFGGGYGAMALISRRLKFNGRYTIIDLPEFSLLQRFYLSNTIGTDNIEWSEGLSEYDLLIAICSLSEINIETRNSFFERVKAKSYLIVFQHQWQGMDNMKYFTQLMNDSPHLEWRMYPNPHYRNHWYLIGK